VADDLVDPEDDRLTTTQMILPGRSIGGTLEP
jgi:hypothetical protein